MVKGTVGVFDRQGQLVQVPIAELRARLSRLEVGYRNDQRVPALVVDEDGYREVDISGADAQRLFTDPNSGFMPLTAEVLDQVADNRQREVYSQYAGTAFVMGAADELSFGMSSRVQRALGGAGTEEAQRGVIDASPNAHLGGRLLSVAGSLIPGAGAGRAALTAIRGGEVARGAGTAIRAGLSSGGGNASMRLGELAADATRSGLSRVGVTGGANEALAIGARGLTEGAVQGISHEITQAGIDNAPLDAGKILADGGLMMGALGLGVELGMHGLGRGIRAARGANRAVRTADSPGSLVLNEVRLGAREAANDNIAPPTFTDQIEQASRSQLQQTNNPLARTYNNIANVVSGVPVNQRDRLHYIANPEVRRLAQEVDSTIDTFARTSADRMRRIDDIAEDALSPVVGPRRLDRYRAEFDSLDPHRAWVSTKETLARMEGEIQGALVAPGANRYATQEGSLGGIAGRIRELGSKLDELPLSPAVVYEELDGLRSGMDKLIGGLSGQAKSLALRQQDALKDLLRDASVWGRVAGDEATRAKVLHDYLTAREVLQNRVGAKKPGSLSKTKEFNAPKLKALYGQLGDVRGDDVHSAIEEYSAAAVRAVKAMESMVGADKTLIQRLQREAIELRREITRAQDSVEARTMWRESHRDEHQGSGFNAVANLGGGSMIGFGVLTGNVPMAIGGGAVNIATAAISRPAGFYRRLDGMQAAYDRYGKRLAEGLDTFAKRLGSAQKRSFLQGTRAVPMIHLKLKEYDRDPETYRLVRDRIEGLAASPEQLAETLAVSTQGIREVNPEIEMYLQLAAVRGVQYLAANMPPEVRDPLFPNEPGLPPSRSVMDSFLRKVMGVEDPLSILDDLNNGTISHEKAEAVRIVHPDVHTDIVNGILVALTQTQEGTRRKVPYQTKMQLHTLFNMDTDVSLFHDNVRRAQTRFAQTSMQQDQIMPRQTSRATRSRFSNSTMTETQRLLE